MSDFIHVIPFVEAMKLTASMMLASPAMLFPNMVSKLSRSFTIKIPELLRGSATLARPNTVQINLKSTPAKILMTKMRVQKLAPDGLPEAASRSRKSPCTLS